MVLHVDPIKLAEDFQEVSLEDTKSRIVTPRVVSVTEYSDSSFSSNSSSRSSTNTDEDYDINNVDLNFAATAAGKARSPDSSNRSSVASVASDDMVATPNTISSEYDDTEDTEFTITANKLNGYAINTLKSKSSITLLNPNQASLQSRQELSNREPPQLFSLSNSSTPSTTSPISPATRSFPTRPRQTLPSSPSLLVQANQASQGLRVKQFTSKIPTTAIIEEETDSIAALPQRQVRKASSTSRLQEFRPRIRRSASAKVLNTNTDNAAQLPTIRQGLTAQQRLRLRRQNSTSKLTVEQLELQCDSDDADDDIPGDTLVWNVPLSPALFAKQSAQQAVPQPKSSKRPHENPGLSSIKEAEPTQYFNAPGLENLSEDARNLTRAFQELPKDAYEKKAGSTLKLPPKRRSNDFMDPVPISKEKAAVLTRTRPSWLPPKSQSEEARHLYEYQQMMALATAADKKREAAKKSERAARQQERAKDEREWRKNVLPHFERAVQEPRTRELWWRGIPTKYRALIWKARAGNILGITESTYKKALSRGKEMEAKAASGEADAKYKAMFELIVKDSARALPELGLFGSDSPMNEQLRDILIAFAFYRPEIGYKSGLHQLAATLLLNLTTFEAFVALAGMLNHSMCQALYMRDERTMTGYYTSFLKVLNTKLPTLYQHFKTIRLPPSAYLEPMLTSLYAEHTSPDITCRIWDVMFFEGDSFLLRVALGILMKTEHKLYGSAEEVLKIVGWGAPKLSLGDEDDGDSFMSVVRGALKTNA